MSLKQSNYYYLLLLCKSSSRRVFIVKVQNLLGVCKYFVVYCLPLLLVYIIFSNNNFKYLQCSKGLMLLYMTTISFVICIIELFSFHLFFYHILYLLYSLFDKLCQLLMKMSHSLPLIILLFTTTLYFITPVKGSAITALKQLVTLQAVN